MLILFPSLPLPLSLSPSLPPSLPLSPSLLPFPSLSLPPSPPLRRYCSQVDPETQAASLIVANSVNGFRATYRDSASLILNCEAPGCAPPRYYLEEYSEFYTKLVRPARRVFPWDGDTPLELEVLVRRHAAEPELAHSHAMEEAAST